HTGPPTARPPRCLDPSEREQRLPPPLRGGATLGAMPLAAPRFLHYEDNQAVIHKVVVGPYDNNVFVLRCKQTGDAVLLDAANEHDRLLDLAKRLNVRQVLETHGHWDHIQAVPEMRDAGYSVYVTQQDAGMLPSYDE